MDNVAYTKKNLAIRAEYDYLFQERFFDETEDYPLADGKYQLTVQSFVQKEKQRVLSAYKFTIMNKEQEVLLQQKILEKRFFYFLKHSNKSEYLLFNIDLYGYSILNLTTKDVYHYMPKEVLQNKESFIWEKVDYLPKEDVLVVEGCFWACPNTVEKYGFAHPEQLPYKIVKQ